MWLLSSSKDTPLATFLNMANAAAILEAARDAQMQLMVRNDVSKLPLWFGVPSKDTITGRQWVERVERVERAII